MGEWKKSIAARGKTIKPVCRKTQNQRERESKRDRGFLFMYNSERREKRHEQFLRKASDII